MDSLPPVRAQAFQPARLRLARQLRGLQQSELARELELSAGAISQLESGGMPASPELLNRLALVLRCRPGFFVRPWKPLTLAEPFFRSRRSTPKKERQRAEAYAVMLAEIGQAIEEWVELPPLEIHIALSASPETGPEEIERAAQLLREAWCVPRGPVPNVVRLLESKGAVAAAVGTFDQRLDAFSVRTRRRPVVVLCSDAGNAARRRFDAAHELGHLVLHPDPADANHWQEQQAQRFAAAFLMPAGEIDTWLPRRSNQLDLLENGSRVWGVSMQALLYRAKDLGALSEHGHQQVMRRLSAAGWRKQEPVDIGPAEAPELLALTVRALPPAGTTLSQVAETLGLTEARLGRMIALPEDRMDGEGELVDMPARAS